MHIMLGTSESPVRISFPTVLEFFLNRNPDSEQSRDTSQEPRRSLTEGDSSPPRAALSAGCGPPEEAVPPFWVSGSRQGKTTLSGSVKGNCISSRRWENAPTPQLQ